MPTADSQRTFNPTYTYLITILLICTIGIVLRVFLIQSANWKVDYDEAMIGLLTRQALEREFMAFVPGQPTLGSIEAYLLTPLFMTLGDNIYTFRLYSVLANVGYILSCIYLGQTLGDKRTALLAGLFAAVAPAYMIVTGLKTWGATIETIILGNILFVTVVNAINDDRRRWITSSGVIAGLLFWNSWLSVYYLLPAGIFVLFHYKKTLKHIPYAVSTFFIGSSPLWIHNILNGWESFQTVLDESTVRGVSRFDTLIDLGYRQYPKLVTGYEAWFPSIAPIVVVAVVIYTLGLVFMLYHAVTKRNNISILLIGMLVVIPLIYIQSGYSAAAFNAYSVDATGRYLLMIHSALPIGVALLVRSSPKYLAVLISGMLLLVNVVGISQINASWAFDSPYYNRQPDNMLEITQYLIDHDYRYVWTDVGIAQPLMLYSSGMIQAADYYDYYNGGIQRFPETFDQVYNARNVIFLVPIIPGQTDTPISRSLNTANIEYETVYLDTIAIYVPSQHVNPELVIDGLGLQY